MENISFHVSDPAGTATRPPVFCRAYFALINIVAWSYTVNLIKRTQQRENTTVNIGLQRLTTVRNKTIDSILFFFMKCCEPLLTVVNRSNNYVPVC